MKLSLFKAILLLLAATAGQVAVAQSADNAAVAKAQQTRRDVAEKQKALAEAQRVDVPAPATPAAPLVLPIDDTDSPGATK